MAVVSTGWPAAAKGFAQHMQLPDSVPVLCDQGRASFGLLELRRSTAATIFSLRVARNFLKLRRLGFKQGKTQGDAWQQGGAAVVSLRGELLYRFASKAPDDALPLDQILAAAQQASVGRERHAEP